MKRETILKLFLTILLFAIVFTKINSAELAEILVSLNALYFLMALVLVPTLYVIRTYRWNLLLKSIGINKPFMDLFRIIIIGVFYGLLTPGKIGEFGRAYHLSEAKSAVIPTVLIEKIIDILVLVLLSGLTLTVFFSEYSTLVNTVLVLGLTTAIGTILLTNRRCILFFTKFLKIPTESIERFSDTCLGLLKNKNITAKAIFYTLSYYVVNYLIGCFILLSLGVDWTAVITLPVILILGNIPITFSGLGLRESVATLTFILLGFGGVQGFSFSLLIFFTITLIPGIIGYLLTLKSSKQCPKESTQAPFIQRER
ncbi:Lysylphosphatidylglycerol synthase TM region [anaerobic digester metagenome]